MNLSQFKRAAGVALTSLAVATLVACGGGSDGTAGLTVKGVAATGLALASAGVTVQCKSGTGGSATTIADGSYSVSITNGTGPCLVTVVSQDGSTTLYGIANQDTDGNNVEIANVNPISSAIVAAIAAAKGNVPFADLTGAQAPSSAEITAAADSVVAVLNAALQAAGSSITLTAAQLLNDPTFKAATDPNNPTAGTALDQALEALKAAGQLSADGALDPNLTAEINTAVDAAVNTTPTGSTGGTGGTGGSTT